MENNRGCCFSKSQKQVQHKNCLKEMSKPINAKCECKYDMDFITMVPMAKEINTCNKMWD